MRVTVIDGHRVATPNGIARCYQCADCNGSTLIVAAFVAAVVAALAGLLAPALASARAHVEHADDDQPADRRPRVRRPARTGRPRSPRGASPDHPRQARRLERDRPTARTPAAGATGRRPRRSGRPVSAYLDARGRRIARVGSRALHLLDRRSPAAPSRLRPLLRPAPSGSRLRPVGDELRLGGSATTARSCSSRSIP